MKRSCLLLLVLFLFSCTAEESQTILIDSIAYEDALLNCLQIKNTEPGPNSRLIDNCLVGSRLPSFEVSTIDGGIINNKSLEGKLSIINFWFTTCPPCIDEIPGFNLLYNRYGSDKINFIAIGRNTKQEINDFLANHPWSFTHISNETDIINKVFKLPTSYPTTLLLNREGQIIRSYQGGGMGQNAIDLIQRRLIAPIEEELRTSPLKDRNGYLRHVGDISYDSLVDNQSFQLCTSDEQITQYYSDSNGMQYKQEKSAIIKIFEDKFVTDIGIKDSGVLTLRFVVNCKGQTGRFRISGMNEMYEEMIFHSSISDQILSIAKSLDGWQVKRLYKDPVDYYQILSFKIRNGQIIELLP